MHDLGLRPQHRRVLDRLDDVHVAGAAADVAADRPADLVVRRVGIVLDQGGADEHHPRGAETALQAVLLVKADLHRREAGGCCQSFHGGDAATVRLHRELGARLDGLRVDQDRAGAATRRVASDVSAGQPEVGAKEVDEQDARLDVAAPLRAVDFESDLHCPASFARCTAVLRPRCTNTRTTSFLYAALPRMSSFGSAASAASRAASANTSSVACLPCRNRSASTAWMFLGPTAVRPIPAISILSPCRCRWTATATVAKSPTLRSSLR